MFFKEINLGVLNHSMASIFLARWNQNQKKPPVYFDTNYNLVAKILRVILERDNISAYFKCSLGIVSKFRF